MTAPVRDPHRHVLTVPVSDEQLAEDVAAFLAEGLTAGERVAYFDDDTAGLVLSRLADDGVDVTGPLRSGQFQLVPGDFTRAALHAPLDELTGVMEQNITSALDDGWAGLRFSGQMDHGLRRPGGQVLDEYDRRLDDAVRDHPLRACIRGRLLKNPTIVIQMRAVLVSPGGRGELCEVMRAARLGCSVTFSRRNGYRPTIRCGRCGGC